MNQMINSISLTGNWELDIQHMLEQYNKLHTYEHSVRVANEAKRIAKRESKSCSSMVTGCLF
ncbi:hypothetical protein V7024_23700 [Bacillus sp. JJ864]|uniref:hypothetical protein n=1 Tax=Bacillus sp. JJ864 TaxID=3122975 RepID=UPI002FFF52DE